MQGQKFTSVSRQYWRKDARVVEFFCYFSTSGYLLGHSVAIITWILYFCRVIFFKPNPLYNVIILFINI